MDKKEIINNWISSFASNVKSEELQKHVFADCNFLWHIFSWEFVPCLSGNEARKAFDSLQYEKAIMFHCGYSQNGINIKNITVTGKISASDLEKFNDVYVSGVNYDWTYVHTHEEDCGPYFYKK